MYFLAVLVLIRLFQFVYVSNWKSSLFIGLHKPGLSGKATSLGNLNMNTRVNRDMHINADYLYLPI